MTDGRPTATDRVLAGRYRLLRPLDRGGIGEVWEATDEVLSRVVAVKLLVPDVAVDREFADRFRREAVAAARLVHPNIVSVYDTGGEGDESFIVMELVSSTSLRDVLARSGALDLRLVVEIGAQVADALDHAHRAGIVHRSLAPASILLADDGRAMVADFGVARPHGPAASPEPGDPRTDVHALGVVLYEMICGRSPEADPIPPRRVRAGIPRPLEQLVLRAMADDPAARFASAADLRAALLAVNLGDDDAVPMVVREDTPPEGVPSFGQSERSWLVPAAAIVVVAVVLGIAGVLFAGTDVGRDILGTGPAPGTKGATTTSPPSLVDPRLFDPEGDGDEHTDEVPNLVDGDASRGWETHRYHGPRFGGLKGGVGLVFEVDGGSQPLGRLVVASPTQGWSAEVYVAERAGTSLGDWGRPVARATTVPGDGAFDLDERRGAVVLLWITDPGPAAKLVVGEVSLAA